MTHQTLSNMNLVPRGRSRFRLKVAPSSDPFRPYRWEIHSQETGNPLKRPTIRTQMVNYVNSGMVERVSNGSFRLTEAAIQAIGGLSSFSEDESSDTEKPAAGGAQAAGLFREASAA